MAPPRFTRWMLIIASASSTTHRDTSPLDQKVSRWHPSSAPPTSTPCLPPSATSPISRFVYLSTSLPHSPTPVTPPHRLIMRPPLCLRITCTVSLPLHPRYHSHLSIRLLCDHAPLVTCFHTHTSAYILETLTSDQHAHSTRRKAPRRPALPRPLASLPLTSDAALALSPPLSPLHLSR